MKTIQSFVNIVHVQSVAVENEDDLSKKQCLEVTRVTSFWIWRQLELCEEEFIRTAHYVDACYPKVSNETRTGKIFRKGSDGISAKTEHFKLSFVFQVQEIGS
ncbi:hypothetical protein B9Z55_003267 [Caenorhabditis nigoni]|uniref:Uncharacterized protein n=1 Tax=Caenorhabditis nigoni TaxID=1611254 RepID=A0A2G5VP96_9PELO|nr:hypothetical protein B9Z55_003267 [Caenorhabditis nigoni]